MGARRGDRSGAGRRVGTGKAARAGAVLAAAVATLVPVSPGRAVEDQGRAASARRAPGLHEPLRVTAPMFLPKGDTSWTGRDVIVDGVTVVVEGPRWVRSLWVTNGGIVTHVVGSGQTLELTVQESVRVDAGCAITASGRGGDGSAERGHDGGSLRLVVGGVLSVDGWISANGRPGSAESIGGGHGGTVQIVAAALVGEGRVVACGGDAGMEAGGGRGGRVAVRVGAVRGEGVVSAAAGRGWADGEAASEPVLVVDAAMLPGVRVAAGVREGWRVEGVGAGVTGWALVE